MVKKSLIIAQDIYKKVDGVFHKLFFDRKIDFDISGLEIIVEEIVDKSPITTGPISRQANLFEQNKIQPIPQYEYKHNFNTRGQYIKIDTDHIKTRRPVAFKGIEDEIVWKHKQPLLLDYLEQIAKKLGRLHYDCSLSGRTLVVKSAIHQNGIKEAIQSHISKKGGYLMQEEFINLTNASEDDLVRLFGPERIGDRVYSTHDVLRYSKKFTYIFEERIVGRAIFRGTKDNPNANIMKIYRGVIDGNISIRYVLTGKLLPSNKK